MQELLICHWQHCLWNSAAVPGTDFRHCRWPALSVGSQVPRLGSE